MCNEKLERKYYHYIYKIIFLKGSPENRYYIGKRSFYGVSIEKDRYTGSGNFCFAYFKKYGTIYGETYIREIIEENPDMDTNRDREDFWVGDLWKTDPLCMNQGPGGKGCAEHKTLIECQNEKKKWINQYDLEGHFIKTWHGVREASRELKINRTGITACINGRKPSAFNFQWRVFDGTTNDIDPFYHGIPVDQYTLNGEFVASYESMMEAARAVGLDKHPDFIRHCCNNKKKSTRNSIWRLSGELLTKEHIDWVNSRKEIEVTTPPINQYTRDGIFVAQYKSIAEAERVTGISRNTISSCILKRPLRKTAGGFVWKIDGNDFTKEDSFYQGVPVNKYDLNGNFICSYHTIAEAARDFPPESFEGTKTGINSCCRRKNLSAKGFIWRYNDDTVTKEDLEAFNNIDWHPNTKRVRHFSADRILIKEYKSAKIAAEETNRSDNTIRDYCKGVRHPKDKTIWKYVND